MPVEASLPPSPLATMSLFTPLPSTAITVLLIDDQQIIAEAIKRMLLDQRDIAFYSCTEAAIAMEMIEKVKPTVILQDLVMPDCDGLSLVKQFRENPDMVDIPIIVLSTRDDPGVKSESFLSGANDYVIKLPDKLELVARIRYHSTAFIRLLERNEAFKRIEESQNLIKADLAEAARYVQAVLPEPINETIQTQWQFIPSTLLGGDVFGYHWIDDDHFAFYLIDVCGHGIGAALLSISVANVIRYETLPGANFIDPKSVLQALNATFQMENHNNMFFTAWYGVYNKNNHEVVFSSGGHPPVIVLSENKPMQTLKTPDIAIGAISDAVFNNGSCQIEPGDRLYLYSDGVYEVFKKDGALLEILEFFEILKALASEHGDTPSLIVRAMQEIQEKTAFADDVSIVEFIFK